MTFLVDRDKEIQELRELKMQDTAVENCQDEARLEEVKKGSAIAGDRGNECNLNRPYRFYCLRRRCCCSGGEVLREASALTFWKNPFSLWRPVGIVHRLRTSWKKGMRWTGSMMNE